MPALLIGGGLFLFGLWLANATSGAVVRRPAPPVPGRRPDIQPSRPSITPVRPPAAPGVSPAMTHAMDMAQEVHDSAPPTPSMPTTLGPDGVPTSHYQSRPSDSVSMTSTPPSGPRRPSPPPSRVTHEEMLGTAHSLATILNQSHEGHEEEVTELVRRFQSEYGHGLRVDGVYGPRTRQALATALGVSVSTLPEHLS